MIRPRSQWPDGPLNGAGRCVEKKTPLLNARSGSTQMTIIGQTPLNTTAGLRSNRSRPAVASRAVDDIVYRRHERPKPIPISELCGLSAELSGGAAWAERGRKPPSGRSFRRRSHGRCELPYVLAQALLGRVRAGRRPGLITDSRKSPTGYPHFRSDRAFMTSSGLGGAIDSSSASRTASAPNFFRSESFRRAISSRRDGDWARVFTCAFWS